jgi:DNA-binding GntR family transcriptional regulator
MAKHSGPRVHSPADRGVVAPVSPRRAITRRYLHDEAADRLRELIWSGDLEPKARINEAELCKDYGISRTPLREAIKMLAAEGLLELSPSRGAQVASLSDHEIDEMLEVIAGVEATAADILCQVITDEEIAEFQELHDRLIRAWKGGDESEYLRLNRQIHEGIIAASRNGALQGLHANLARRVQRARYSAHKTAAQWDKAAREHEEMMILLRARASEKLSNLMRKHIRGKKPVIAAAFGQSARTTESVEG